MQVIFAMDLLQTIAVPEIVIHVMLPVAHIVLINLIYSKTAVPQSAKMEKMIVQHA